MILPAANLRVIVILFVAAMVLGAAPAAPGNLFGVNGLTITGAGTWTGVSMLAVYLLREWRETRKLSAEDRLARREGYAKQVENLQVENRKLRGDLIANEQLHSEYRRSCQEENDQLRAEIRGLEDDIAGLKRRIDAQGSSFARVVSDGVDAPTTINKLLNNLGDEQ
jgi:hypothetical protein